MRQKFQSDHISGSQTWVYIRIIWKACQTTDVRAPPQSFWFSRTGQDPRTCISHEFPSVADTGSSRTTLVKPLLESSLTFHFSPFILPLLCAKNFLLAALCLAGYLVPWFCPGNSRSLYPFSPLSNKINSWGHQTTWRTDFTSCYPMTYEDTPLEVWSSY